MSSTPHVNTVPTGAVNGVNKTYTLSLDIDLILGVIVDGLPYTGSVTLGGPPNQFVLGTAPTSSIFVTWYDASTTPAAIGTLTLAELKQKLTYAVGTAETNLMTNDKRINAINRAIENILETYPIPQYTVQTAISFTNGLAALPTDCLLPLKLVDPTQVTVDWDQTTWEQFYQQIPQTFNIYYDQAFDAEQIKIYPANTTTLNFFYIQMPPVLVNDEDGIRLKSWWGRAIAEKAAEELFFDTRNFNAAEGKTAIAKDLMAKAWQQDRARIEGIQVQKLTSIYNERSLIGSSGRLAI